MYISHHNLTEVLMAFLKAQLLKMGCVYFPLDWALLHFLSIYISLRPALFKKKKKQQPLKDEAGIILYFALVSLITGTFLPVWSHWFSLKMYIFQNGSQIYNFIFKNAK